MLFLLAWSSAKQQHLLLAVYLKHHKFVCFMLLIPIMIYNLGIYYGIKQREAYYYEIYDISFDNVDKAIEWGHNGIELILSKDRSVIFFPRFVPTSSFIKYFNKNYVVSKHNKSDTIYLVYDGDTINVLIQSPPTIF